MIEEEAYVKFLAHGGPFIFHAKFPLIYDKMEQMGGIIIELVLLAMEKAPHDDHRYDR
jgi:hypothetical protein